MLLKKKKVKKRQKRIYFLPVLPWAPDSLTVGELARAHPFPSFSTNSSLGDSSSCTVSFIPTIFSSSPQRIFRIRFSSEKREKEKKPASPWQRQQQQSSLRLPPSSSFFPPFFIFSTLQVSPNPLLLLTRPRTQDSSSFIIKFSNLERFQKKTWFFS